jgi:hypothetical protein
MKNWILFFAATLLIFQGFAQADPGKSQRPEWVTDMLEEDVPGQADVVKVTHIFRVNKGKPGSAPACSCPGADGSTYSLLKVKWFDPSFNYNIYTLNTSLGASAATAVASSFAAWKNAEPASPAALLGSVNASAAGPGIALDGEQNVSWQPLSATYGPDTLAVTVYWYSRLKIGGFSRISHFDMAFNTDYAWVSAGATESCGGGSGFDVQDVGTHEAGHALGMGHNNGCNLTMNPTASQGETSKSTLGAGDILGIQAIY